MVHYLRRWCYPSDSGPIEGPAVVLRAGLSGSVRSSWETLLGAPGIGWRGARIRGADRVSESVGFEWVGRGRGRSNRGAQ